MWWPTLNIKYLEIILKYTKISKYSVKCRKLEMWRDLSKVIKEISGEGRAVSKSCGHLTVTTALPATVQPDPPNTKNECEHRGAQSFWTIDSHRKPFFHYSKLQGELDRILSWKNWAWYTKMLKAKNRDGPKSPSRVLVSICQMKWP